MAAAGDSDQGWFGLSRDLQRVVGPAGGLQEVSLSGEGFEVCWVWSSEAFTCESVRGVQSAWGVLPLPLQSPCFGLRVFQMWSMEA